VNPFPSYPHAELSKPADAPVSIDNYGVLDAVLADGYREGLFGTSPKEANAGRIDRARLRTIAMQLFLLGYLDEKPDSGLSLADIRDELTTFRADAGISLPAPAEGDPSFPESTEENGRSRPLDEEEIDDPTWYAIHSLVAFEPMAGAELDAATIASRWMAKTDDGQREPNDALHRAIRLRLHVLGLGEKPRSDTDLTWDLDLVHPFVRVGRLLQLFGADLPGPAVIIERLFDADGILEALASAEAENDRFRAQILLSRDPQVPAETLQRFITCVAKIELWLLGFNIQPDGENDYPVAGFDDPRSVFERLWRDPLRDPLKNYWRDLVGESHWDAVALAKEVTPSLFKSLLRHGEDEASTAFDKEDYSREIAARELETNTQIQYIWTAVEDYRLSLWDGLTRVWNWMKRKAKAIFRRVGRTLKNIARAVFRYASKAYKIVRLAIRSTIDGIRYVVGGRLASTPPGTALLMFRRDMDSRLVVNPGASSDDVERFGNVIAANGAAFAFAADMVSAILSIAIGVASGLKGWARIIRALVESLRDLKPAYRKLVRAREAASLPV
jgi:hypothetical protein